MICVETQYFSINRHFLRLIGLWPCQRTILVQCQFIFFLGILTSFIIFQMTTFITAQCTIDLFMNVVCSTLYFVGSMIKYTSFYINAEPLRYFLEQSQHICNGLKDENEVAIITKYGNDGKRYTSNIILLVGCSIFILIVQPTLPHVIDAFEFINGSRLTGKAFFVTEYFVNRDEYFYLIVLHTNAAICTLAVTVGATGSVLLAFLKHICGMFSIASYRLEHMKTMNIQGNNLVHKIAIEKRIIYAVDMHRKAMECSEFLISNFEGSFFLLIAVGVLCLSLHFFRVIQLISLADNMEEFCLRAIAVGLIIMYMFLANYAGQEITDHNEHIYCTAYNVQWYAAPLHIQKIILFLLQRGNKIFGLRVGGLFISSLECFATLTSASVSYFTVMYSAQK